MSDPHADVLEELWKLREENKRLRTGWKEAGHRCPQCGTPNRNLENVEAELKRCRQENKRLSRKSKKALSAAKSLRVALMGKPFGRTGYEQSWIDSMVLAAQGVIRALDGEGS